ncbi:MAG: hypothetical protein M1826_007256 [Phylliscum demangeonii]|nr:MAG: hypothetical protein M1826_007256 [Phylliscum demangeonii]
MSYLDAFLASCASVDHLMAFYWTLHADVSSMLAQDHSMLWLSISTAAFVLLTITLSFTRLYSGVRSRSHKTGSSRGPPTAAMLPYWVPFLGHVVSLSKDPDKLIRSHRDGSRSGLFALNLFGQTHNFVYSPALIKGLFQQRSSHFDFASVVWYILHHVFGARSRDKRLYHACMGDLHQALTSTLLRGPHLTAMLASAVGRMEEHIPRLISFSASFVDQDPWERASQTEVVSGLAVETSLCALVRNFMGHLSTPTMFGHAFLGLYPEALEDLWRLDAGFMWLALGVPRWIPIRASTAAHLARARLLTAVTAFHVALDQASAMPTHTHGPNQSLWGDMDEISETMKRRDRVWRAHGAAPASRAAADVSLLWAMNVNANLLCFWLLLRILATPGLLARVRAEIAPYVFVRDDDDDDDDDDVDDLEGAGRPPTITAPPRLAISLHGLCSACPYFKASYLETLRLDSSPWSFKRIKEDFVLASGSPSSTPDTTASSYLFKAGSHVHIPHDAHHTDPLFFHRPDDFLPERFLRIGTATATATAATAAGAGAGAGAATTAINTTSLSPSSSAPSSDSESIPALSTSSSSSSSSSASASSSPSLLVVHPGSLRPYGGGDSMCKGRILAEKECLAFVAGLLAVWDFEPVAAGCGRGGGGSGSSASGGSGGQWRIPAARKATAVALPEEDVRVRVSRRCRRGHGSRGGGGGGGEGGV